MFDLTPHNFETKIFINMLEIKQVLTIPKSKIDLFLESRVTPQIYFKYFYEKPLVKQEVEFSSVHLPKVKKEFL